MSDVVAVIPDQNLLATATEAVQKLAEKPTRALQACKRLMNLPFRDELVKAAKLDNQELATRVASADAKEAFTACREKRAPDFTKTTQARTVA